MSRHPHPIPDQSHLNKIRDALAVWPVSNACVMIGSGFSRNAKKARLQADDPPLWQDIARNLYAELYPGDGSDVDPKVNLPQPSAADTPRIAQEYETAFSRSGLHISLSKIVRDDDFEPGSLHKELLGLPWRDVFTTNWDTLLERADAEFLDSKYSVVADVEQLVSSRGPRIIKLHGSLPHKIPLIVTEEDYRRYPAEFAPFVNTVQQAMLETVVCLIGFSGDDPNFLHWSGWVRDNLGPAAPKIYLLGLLNLTSHRRRMLEDRGVVPIDVANHPQAQRWPRRLRHQKATHWLLRSLQPMEPYDWTTWPSPPPSMKVSVDPDLMPISTPSLNVPLEEIGPDQPHNAGIH